MAKSRKLTKKQRRQIELEERRREQLRQKGDSLDLYIIKPISIMLNRNPRVRWALGKVAEISYILLAVVFLAFSVSIIFVMAKELYSPLDADDVNRIHGVISEAYRYEDSSIFIELEDHPAGDQPTRFRISDMLIYQKNQGEVINNDLRPGTAVTILFDRDDPAIEDEDWIPVAALQTTERVVLSLKERQEKNSANSLLGVIVGVFFFVGALVWIRSIIRRYRQPWRGDIM